MNSRSAQMLTASLAALLVILIGATIFVLLARPPVGPTPSPSPSALVPSASPTPAAVISPAPASALPTPTSTQAPTPAPSPSPTPEITLTPTAEVTASPSPTPSAPPTPTPSPTPSISPSSPGRVLRIFNVGLDNRELEFSIPRVVTFNVDGQSLITAQLSSSSGPIRLCLWREALDDDRVCRTVRNGAVEKIVLETGSSIWHASMIGTAPEAPPSTTLTLRFNSSSPSVSLRNFRYNGAVDDRFNGFRAELTTAAENSLGVQAAFDDGDNGAYSFRLIVRPNGGEPIFDETGGPTQSLDRSVGVPGQEVFEVSLRNPDGVSNAVRQVFVVATISWP